MDDRMDYKFKATWTSYGSSGNAYHHVQYFKSCDEAEHASHGEYTSKPLYPVHVEEAPPGKYYMEDGHLADLDEEHKAAEERVRQQEAEQKESGRRKYGENFEVSNDILIKYKGPDGDVSIPDGIKVIGKEAFYNRDKITSVKIPSSVTNISEEAFYGCESLKSLSIPSNVKYIKDNAFDLCSYKLYVKMPGDVLFSSTRDFAMLEGIAYWYNYYGKKAGNYSSSGGSPGGCYVATAVYGSYDCPQVWTLRRYRDFTLAESLFGRTFIRIYYAVSPKLVKWFGEKKWFSYFWRNILDRKIENLRKRGITDTPYVDRVW
ncbi:hypothetical protein FACS189479_09900 [Spirochaetia bacterium]|nr:hypothetical protein FACS189479_09900 [Spirochaetia bacterium]